MKLRLILIILLGFLYNNTNSTEHKLFNKVIIWGHKLHSHTHSYIHWAFFRAFSYLGYNTYWFDNKDDVSNFDFSNSLFLTEWQVDDKMPLRDDCVYILHNCHEQHPHKHKYLYDKGRCIYLQVYRHEYLDNVHVQKMDDYIYYNLKDQIIYIPWATDLLPDEIEQNKQHAAEQFKNRKDSINYIGTIGSFGEGANKKEINGFARAAQNNNILFNIIGLYSAGRAVDMEYSRQLIKESYMAPAIQGSSQIERGYIPCRIFKNISYGQFGITNSKTVHDLFKGKVIYNSDTYQLFFDAKEKLDTLNLNELYKLMDFVKEKHTYINRIEVLLKFLDMVYDQCN